MEKKHKTTPSTGIKAFAFRVRKTENVLVMNRETGFAAASSKLMKGFENTRVEFRSGNAWLHNGSSLIFPKMSEHGSSMTAASQRMVTA